jgi:hypothetical protein
MSVLRPRTLVILAASALVLLLPASVASAAAFKATLDAPNHSPKGGGKNWDITVTAKSNAGKPLTATARYEFYFDGQRVSTQYPNPGHAKGGTKPYRFKGRYRDTILWPPTAVGHPLTFRVVVSVHGKGSVNLDWKVRVHR